MKYILIEKETNGLRDIEDLYPINEEITDYIKHFITHSLNELLDELDVISFIDYLKSATTLEDIIYAYEELTSDFTDYYRFNILTVSEIPLMQK